MHLAAASDAVVRHEIRCGSHALYLAVVVIVKRPDGKLRPVVDYRGLNRVTIKNRFPFPLIPEMLDGLHLAKVFIKIDLCNAYHQVRVKEGDEWKTAFQCREGHFEYHVCPQGPTNAPAMFQYFMNDILHEDLNVSQVRPSFQLHRLLAQRAAKKGPSLGVG